MPADAAGPFIGDRRDEDEAADLVGIIEREAQRDGAAPGMGDDDGLVEMQLVDDAGGHLGLELERVGVGGAIAEAEAGAVIGGKLVAGFEARDDGGLPYAEV